MWENWWSNDKLITRRNALFNIATGVALVASLAFGWTLGLGSLATPYLAYFAVLSLTWGLLALRFGDDPRIARPLRLAGDIVAWIGFIGFAAWGAFLLDPPEYAAASTLLIAAIITVIGYLANRRGGKQAVTADREPA